MIDPTKGDRLSPPRDPVEVRALHAAAGAVATAAWEIADVIRWTADVLDHGGNVFVGVGHGALGGACRLTEHYELARSAARSRPAAAIYALARAHVPATLTYR